MDKTALILLVLGCLLTSEGCREKPLQPGVIVADRQVALADMSPGEIIVSVNGKALTRKAYEDELDLYVTLYSLRTPTATKRTTDAYRVNRGTKAIPEYVTKQLILQEGKRMGLRLPQEALAAAELKVWQSMVPRKAKDDFTTELGPQTALFKKRVSEDEHVKATREALFADRLLVSDEMIEAALKRRAEWNASYAESNRLVIARGEEIVRELRAGADFAEMAKKVSQHRPDDGEVWGEFTHSEIEDPKLRSVAFQLPVGAISDPIDTDNGLLIIRVLERTSGAETESSVAQRVASVKLAKILLLMYNPFDEISPRQLRARLEQERINEIQKEWVPKLHESARIEYPNGTNLWPKATGKSKRSL